MNNEAGSYLSGVSRNAELDDDDDAEHDDLGLSIVVVVEEEINVLFGNCCLV